MKRVYCFTTNHFISAHWECMLMCTCLLWKLKRYNGLRQLTKGAKFLSQGNEALNVKYLKKKKALAIEMYYIKSSMICMFLTRSSSFTSLLVNIEYDKLIQTPKLFLL